MLATVTSPIRPQEHPLASSLPNGNKAVLIEADDGYRAVIAACIGLAGCRVQPVATTEQALAALSRRPADLVVWGLSARDTARRGETIAEIRLRTIAPIILVEGASDMAQLELEAGADQWVAKPFAPGTLVGAIRAAMRNSSSAVMPSSSQMEVRGMVLDGGLRRLRSGKAELDFTPQEWNLLFIFFSHPNRFLSTREILRLGWRAGDHAPEQLRTYVHKLRQKLCRQQLPCTLLSQHGAGYCLRFE